MLKNRVPGQVGRDPSEGVLEVYSSGVQCLLACIELQVPLSGSLSSTRVQSQPRPSSLCPSS